MTVLKTATNGDLTVTFEMLYKIIKANGGKLTANRIGNMLLEEMRKRCEENG